MVLGAPCCPVSTLQRSTTRSEARALALRSPRRSRGSVELIAVRVHEEDGGARLEAELGVSAEGVRAARRLGLMCRSLRARGGAVQRIAAGAAAAHAAASLRVGRAAAGAVQVLLRKQKRDVAQRARRAAGRRAGEHAWHCRRRLIMLIGRRRNHSDGVLHVQNGLGARAVAVRLALRGRRALQRSNAAGWAVPVHVRAAAVGRCCCPRSALLIKLLHDKR